MVLSTTLSQNLKSRLIARRNAATGQNDQIIFVCVLIKRLFFMNDLDFLIFLRIPYRQSSTFLYMNRTFLVIENTFPGMKIND